jgi:hypothetical protein
MEPVEEAGPGIDAVMEKINLGEAPAPPPEPLMGIPDVT